jgi:hypothetical protein
VRLDTLLSLVMDRPKGEIALEIFERFFDRPSKLSGRLVRSK